MNEDVILGDLLAAAERLCIPVSPIGFVSEPDAEKLLGLGERYLKKLRCDGRPLCAFHRIGGGRVTYSLRDLARAVMEGRYSA